MIEKDILSESTVRLFIAIVLVLVVVYYIFYSVSVYLLLKKAKYKNTWAALVPYYQSWAVYEIAGKPGWWILIGLSGSLVWLINIVLGVENSVWLSITGLLINISTIISLVLTIIVDINLAKSFGKSLAYALGLIFFPVPMYLVLGLSDSKYIGPKKAKSKKK